MRIYYLKNDNLLKTVSDVPPCRNGTIAEHFAHVLAVIDTYAKAGKSAEELKEIFYKLMSANSFMENLLRNSFLIEMYDFSGDDVAQRIAELFELAESDLTTSTETRVIEAIPECPIYLTPIVYGIRFNDDPNWYEIQAAYNWLVTQNKHRSPMNRALWTTISEIKQFSYFIYTLTEVAPIAENREVNQWVNGISYQLSLPENSYHFNATIPRLILTLEINPQNYVRLAETAELHFFSNSFMSVPQRSLHRTNSLYEVARQAVMIDNAIIDNASILSYSLQLFAEAQADNNNNLSTALAAAGITFAAYNFLSNSIIRNLRPHEQEEKEEKSSELTNIHTSFLPVTTGVGTLLSVAVAGVMGISFSSLYANEEKASLSGVGTLLSGAAASVMGLSFAAARVMGMSLSSLSANEEKSSLSSNPFSFFGNRHNQTDIESLSNSFAIDSIEDSSLSNSVNNINYAPLNSGNRHNQTDIESLSNSFAIDIIDGPRLNNSENNINAVHEPSGNNLFQTLRNNFRNLFGLQRQQNSNEEPSIYRNNM